MIFIAITIPVTGMDGGDSFWGFDKIVHFVLFGILALSALSLIKEFYSIQNFKLSNKFVYKTYLCIGFLCFIYILISEYIQNFIPGRFPSEGDVVFGFLGVLSVLVYSYLKKDLFKS